MLRLGAATLLLAQAAGLVAASEGQQLTLQLDGRAATSTMALVSALDRHQHRLAVELTAELANTPVHVAFGDGTKAMLPQALGHSLGLWYASDHAVDLVYTRSPVLPLRGPLRVRQISSSLRRADPYEDLIREVMRPWLGKQSGFSHHPFQGRWAATLDPAGHLRFARIIATIENRRPQIPALVAHPHQPVPGRHLEAAVVAEDWRELIATLAHDHGLNCSLTDRPARQQPGEPLMLPPAELRALPAIIARAGAHAAWIRGVLCLDTEPPRDRRHPGERQRLAVIPVPQFGDDDACALLAAWLRTNIRPEAWQLPGFTLRCIDGSRRLLVAADIPTITAVMAELERREHLDPER
ncbi:MAG: hypothetical protein ACOCZK_02995 [Planctomycetota bacterium]